MITQPLLPWECKLCPARHSNREFMHQHLRDAHRMDEGLDADLTIKLVASRDCGEYFAQVYGYYRGSELLAYHRPNEDF